MPILRLFRRSVLILSALAGMGAACVADAAEAPTSGAPDGAPGWVGVYIGPAPSPLGEAARMVLVLVETGRYQWMHDGSGAREVYAAQSQGPIRWEEGRRTLRLGSGQRFRLADGVAELLPTAHADSPGAAATPSGRLVRQLRFTGPDGELLVDPASVRPGQPQPGWLSFTAIWNLPAVASNGTQSLGARFELYCAGDSYRMADVRGFSQAYLRGQALVSAPPVTPRATTGTLLGQAAHRLCPR